MGQRGRPATGQVREHVRQDGLTTYSLRVRADGGRHNVRLDTEAEGWTAARPQLELANVLAQIRAGIWRPPRPKRRPGDQPTFHEHSSLWLRRKVAEGISDNTRKDLLWRLSIHLLPFFSEYPVGAITAELVEEYKDHELARRERAVRLRDAGEVLRDRGGRTARPLSNDSINKFLRLLKVILEDAVKRGWLATNPAIGVERLPTRRRKGGILEADELESLIEAGGDLDANAKPDGRARALRVLTLRDVDKRSWREIAAELQIASSTAVYLYRRAKARDVRRRDHGRRALIAVLGCGGLRATELAELDVSDIDLKHRKIRVRDAKTETGVREVDLTPRLVDELRAYLASRPDAAPHDPAFPTRSGARRDKDNIRQRVIVPAMRRANELRGGQGLPPIGTHVTPHTLRRTYISLMLAAGAEVPYVQAQVGHADPSLTLEIYAFVLKRRDRRRFGEAFDALMRDAIPSMQAAKMQNVQESNGGGPVAATAAR